MARSRRFRPQPVAHVGARFISSADSHADPFSSGSAALPPLQTRSVLPAGVRRLLADDDPSSPFSLSQNWSPARSRWETQSVFHGRRGTPVVNVGPSIHRRRAPVGRHVVQQAVRSADWAAFRKLKVQAPSRVAFCVRRVVRRQVLFASRIAGNHKRLSPGRGGQYRRNAFSSWSC